MSADYVPAPELLAQEFSALVALLVEKKLLTPDEASRFVMAEPVAEPGTGGAEPIG